MALPCALAAVVLLGAGCTANSLNSAPVEDLGTGLLSPVPTAMPARQLPGFENAGKPGYYTIKPGDTMFRIGRENGQNWRDIVRWNNIENPNLIEVGQVLRVVPPGASTQPVSSGSVVARPAQPVISPVQPFPNDQPVAGDDNVGWIWPAQGSLLAGFSEAKNKGLDIAGKAGDTVMASADGKVVYAGAGLRGYGNLIILKHNNTFLTAYAHNRSLLVKEDQSVKRGQKIAEMGSTDADRVKLHFEIRRQGKPVDPAKYLPAR
ncbi:MAG: peptidoglycan DD-metalloendopeptidase family protein [Pseudomonadota bacterium]|nr:peptidoglycan DD-metalloendopeptidase family protein [Pseudomonadota bacterium]